MRDLSILESAMTAETKEQKDYVNHCRDYGLEIELLGKEISFMNKTYIVEGLIKKGSFICIKCSGNKLIPISTFLKIIKN